jgi:hypothetical protein
MKHVQHKDESHIIYLHNVKLSILLPAPYPLKVHPQRKNEISA